jgi:hypothetical protein
LKLESTELLVLSLPGIRDQGSGIRDQGSGIRDQGSGIRDQGLGFRRVKSKELRGVVDFLMHY